MTYTNERYFEQQRNDTDKENTALIVSAIIAVFSAIFPGIILPILGIIVALYWIAFVMIANRLKKAMLQRIKIFNEKFSKLFGYFNFLHIRLFVPVSLIIYYVILIIAK